MHALPDASGVVPAPLRLTAGAPPQAPRLCGGHQRGWPLWNPFLACGRDGDGARCGCCVVQPARTPVGWTGLLCCKCCGGGLTVIRIGGIFVIGTSC